MCDYCTNLTCHLNRTGHEQARHTITIHGAYRLYEDIAQTIWHTMSRLTLGEWRTFHITYPPIPDIQPARTITLTYTAGQTPDATQILNQLHDKLKETTIWHA